MSDSELVQAVCCVAGTGSDLTVEELQLVKRVAETGGIERSALETGIAKAATDAGYLEQQIGVVTKDVGAAIQAVVRSARKAGVQDDGHFTMALWRVATRVGVSPERFDAMLASAT